LRSDLCELKHVRALTKPLPPLTKPLPPLTKPLPVLTKPLQVAPEFAAIMFWTYIFFVAIVCLNVLLAILIEAFGAGA
jgi:hypothetical protein